MRPVKAVRAAVRSVTLSAPIMRNTKHGLPDGRRGVTERTQRIRHT
nr:MAG TPA: hypothetical protein [Caudoviricetes sp.]